MESMDPEKSYRLYRCRMESPLDVRSCWAGHGNWGLRALRRRFEAVLVFLVSVTLGPPGVAVVLFTHVVRGVEEKLCSRIFFLFLFSRFLELFEGAVVELNFFFGPDSGVLKPRGSPPPTLFP